MLALKLASFFWDAMKNTLKLKISKKIKFIIFSEKVKITLKKKFHQNSNNFLEKNKYA